MFRPRISLRAKVLLASSVLLVIPYVGYRYVQETENFLRDGLETSVLNAAQALAGALHERVDLLAGYAAGSDEDARDIFVHPLAHAMQMDGYLSDWREYRDRLEPIPYGQGAAGFSARYLVGTHGDYLYALIEVTDPRVDYRRPAFTSARLGDQLAIRLGSPEGAPRQYRIAPISAGWASVYAVISGRVDAPLRRREPRIWAQWQPVPGGYTVEMRIPLTLAGRRMGIDVIDIDPGNSVAAGRLSTVRGGTESPPGKLVFSSPEIDGIIQNLGRTPGRRVRVVDTRGRVLAGGGDLATDTPVKPVNPIIALLLPPPSAELFEEHANPNLLSGPEINAALRGEQNSRWQSTANPGIYVVSAAYPIWIGQNVAGAVVVEETSASIQTVRRQALADLFNITLMVFTGAGLLLFVFANRISFRLRRLRDDAEGAIDEHGRVAGRIHSSTALDEIGDLGRSFATLMARLQQYNHYLEQLARRLSHELRTPLAVIRSSLDTLSMGQQDPADTRYVERAREGLERLETIIVRMSEATRLEEALQSAERVEFDLAEVVAASVESYRQAWPALNLDYAAPAGPCRMNGVPDLIVQMMDKLVGNARDFTPPEDRIRVRLESAQGGYVLRVANDGPPLPGHMSERLFDSMVSIRERKSGAEPHLGLGLYIVRLIAEFHGGKVAAQNVADGTGVEFRVVIPRA
ncbi:MAG TPA: proteobacterial dedicated sortase system histidine kinase, partial [Gammaproteobacteria bacterium]